MILYSIYISLKLFLVHICISRFIVIFFSSSHSFVRYWSLSGPARARGAALGLYGISENSLASDSAVGGFGIVLWGPEQEGCTPVTEEYPEFC